jgi:hypothetical protein
LIFSESNLIEKQWQVIEKLQLIKKESEHFLHEIMNALFSRIQAQDIIWKS